MRVKTTVEFDNVGEAAGWLCQYTTTSAGIRGSIRRHHGIGEDEVRGREVAIEAVKMLARRYGLRVEGDAPVVVQGAPRPSWIDGGGNIHLLSEMPDSYLRNVRPFAEYMAQYPRSRTFGGGRGLLDAIDAELSKRAEENRAA
jgi:hypothetical protein